MLLLLPLTRHISRFTPLEEAGQQDPGSSLRGGSLRVVIREEVAEPDRIRRSTIHHRLRRSPRTRTTSLAQEMTWSTRQTEPGAPSAHAGRKRAGARRRVKEGVILVHINAPNVCNAITDLRSASTDLRFRRPYRNPEAAAQAAVAAAAGAAAGACSEHRAFQEETRTCP